MQVGLKWSVNVPCVIVHDDTVQMIRSDQQVKKDGKLWGMESQVVVLSFKCKGGVMTTGIP